MSRLILLNKPYGVICQFSPDGIHPTLADHVDVPGVYPAGRRCEPSKAADALVIPFFEESQQPREERVP